MKKTSAWAKIETENVHTKTAQYSNSSKIPWKISKFDTWNPKIRAWPVFQSDILINKAEMWVVSIQICQKFSKVAKNTKKSNIKSKNSRTWLLKYSKNSSTWSHDSNRSQCHKMSFFTKSDHYKTQNLSRTR